MTEAFSPIPTLSPERVDYSYLQRERQSRELVRDGREQLELFAAAAHNFLASNTPDGGRRLLKIGGHTVRLRALFNDLTFATAAGSRQESEIPLDDPFLLERGFLNRTDSIPLSEEEKKQAFLFGAQSGKQTFLDLLQKPKTQLLPFRRDLAVVSRPTVLLEVGEAEDLVALYETKLSQVYYQCSYTFGVNHPDDSLVVYPFTSIA